MSQRLQKIIALVLLVILLVAIPITIKFGAQQEQTVSQHAQNTYTGGAGDYPCGGPTVKIYANDSCVNGAIQAMPSYGVDAVIGLENGSTGAYTVYWKWKEYFCTDGNGASGPCVDETTAKTKTGSGGITSTLVAHATTDTVSPSQYGSFSACGRYQFDMGFKVVANTSGATLCNYNYDSPNLGTSNAFWASCASNVICAATPTNTPTPTPTTPVTATPTTPVTPTDTPTPTPTGTPSPTPTGTTPTPTTVTNTPTPGPTSTPMPPTPTPKPLPPTGPGDTIIGIGLLGAVAAAIGVVVILAL